MSLELMDTFVRIVEARSLSAAAMLLGTSQPTVSRRLQALEQQLGVRLLQRSTHSLQLTLDGERCFKRAKDLLANWAAFEADLRGTPPEPSGRLRVATPHAFDPRGVIAPLAQFLSAYPGVSVEWLFRDEGQDYAADDIDCAIQWAAPTDPTLVAVRLSEVPRMAVAAPSLLAGMLPAHPEELAALPWLSLKTHAHGALTFSEVPTGETVSLCVQSRLCTDSLDAIRSAALLGLGVCVCPTALLADDVAQGRLVHLLPNWIPAPLPVYLTYPHAPFHPSKLLRFVSFMRDAVQVSHQPTRPPTPYAASHTAPHTAPFWRR